MAPSICRPRRSTSSTGCRRSQRTRWLASSASSARSTGRSGPRHSSSCSGRARASISFVPDQKVSLASVSHTLDAARLPAGSRVVGSIHSHGAFGAWASAIDEDDEAEFDGLHIVVGRFDRRPAYSAAIAVDGRPLRGPGDRCPRTAPEARRAAGGVVSASEAPAAATAVEGQGPPILVHRRSGAAPGSRCPPGQPRRSRRRARPGGWPGRSAWAPAQRLARPGSPGRVGRGVAPMPDRVVLIGLRRHREPAPAVARPVPLVPPGAAPAPRPRRR